MNSKARQVEHLVAKFANERRASRGLDRLDSDRALTSAAREHSRWMARHELLTHYRGAGLKHKTRGPSSRVKKYEDVAENISKRWDWSRPPGKIAGHILDGWMRSKDHRENILKADYVGQGIGVWKNGDIIYTTQMFLPKWADYEQTGGLDEDPIGDFIDDVKRRLPIG